MLTTAILSYVCGHQLLLYFNTLTWKLSYLQLLGAQPNKSFMVPMPAIYNINIILLTSTELFVRNWFPSTPRRWNMGRCEKWLITTVLGIAVFSSHNNPTFYSERKHHHQPKHDGSFAGYVHRCTVLSQQCIHQP